MRKPSKTTLKNKCDDLWRDIIHLKKYCGVCGTPYTTNAHHIVGKKNTNLRWDLRNGCLLCVSHHKFGKESAHEDQPWFDDWLRNNRLEDYLYVKQQKFRKTKTWYISDYEEIYKNLKEEYERRIQ